MRLLVLLLLVPLVAGTTTFTVTDPAPGGFTVTPTMAVFEGDALGTHKNFGFQVLQGDHELFNTTSLHEHDALATLLYTVPESGTVTYRITGDEVLTRHTEITPLDPPTPASLASMEGTRLHLDGDVLRFEKEDTKGIRGQWVVRDASGILLTGWMATHGLQTFDLATIHADGEVRAEMFLVGRAGAREISTTGTTTPTMSELPILEDLQLPPCAAGILDPAEVVAGNVVRFVQADAARITGTPKDHRVDYELRRAEEPLGQSVVYAWTSAGPLAQTSFRVPSEGDFMLVVEEAGNRCQESFTATAPSTETAALVTSFVAADGVIEGFADVPGDAHYEYPMELRYLANGTEGSKLVFAGKLHSHGGGVSFKASHLPPGEYEWIVDVDAQGADPIVPTGLSGHRTLITLAAPEETPVEETTFLPLLLVVLALIGLGTSRR
ncbi:MAG: hypothetical protein ACPHK8_02450 [Thermoplasmatota archaeon]